VGIVTRVDSDYQVRIASPVLTFLFFLCLPQGSPGLPHTLADVAAALLGMVRINLILLLRPC
jgi:hypothetical protein